jgi:hypothetical protein
MTRLSSAASLALTVLALLGLTGPARAQVQVPFKGSLQGTFTVTPVSTPPPIVDIRLSARGNATHLGKFTLDFPHRVNLATGFGAGAYQFTAANGDKLFASGTGQSAPTVTPGVVRIVETATITGGTGRFANAKGSFTCERLVNQGDRTTIGSFKGSISRGP